MARATLLVAFPVIAALIGAALALLRPPGQRVTVAVQHFAAGVVFAAVALEVLPSLHDSAIGYIIAGFVLGVAVMLLLRQVETRAEARSRSWLPLGLAVAVGVDLLIDGLLIGIGAHVGLREGIILTAALTLEILFLALAVTAELTERGARRGPAALTITALHA